MSLEALDVKEEKPEGVIKVASVYWALSGLGGDQKAKINKSQLCC